MKEVTEGVAKIPNTLEIKKNPKVDKEPFETAADQDRMDYDVARDKARFERVPRSGEAGKDVEHHRRAAGLRRRVMEGITPDTDGWKALPKGLIEAVKTLLKAPKEKDEGAPAFKGKHPYLEKGNEKNKKDDSQ